MLGHSSSFHAHKVPMVKISLRGVVGRRRVTNLNPALHAERSNGHSRVIAGPPLAAHFPSKRG